MTSLHTALHDAVADVEVDHLDHAQLQHRGRRQGRHRRIAQGGIAAAAVGTPALGVTALVDDVGPTSRGPWSCRGDGHGRADRAVDTSH